MHRLLCLLICGLAVAQPPTTAPATKPALATPLGWGAAADGIVAFLAVDQPTWPAGQTPRFRAAVANIGARQDLSICQVQDLCEVELDGRWHQWVGSSDVKSTHLLPQQQYDDITITLDELWSPLDGGGRITILPGRHSLRVAFLPMTSNFMPPGIRAVSNPVVFTITAPTTRPAIDRH